MTGAVIAVVVPVELTSSNFSDASSPQADEPSSFYSSEGQAEATPAFFVVGACTTFFLGTLTGAYALAITF